MKRLAYKLTLGFAFAVLALSAANTAYAQYETRGPGMLGTGGGGPSFVRNNDAILFNPANLVLNEHNDRAVVSLGNTMAHSGGNLFQFNYYNDFFTNGHYITDAEATQVLDGWFGAASTDQMRSAGLYADIVPLAVTIHGQNWAMGFASRARAYNSVGISRGWLDLLLNGTGEDRTLPVNASYQSLLTTDFSIAYSRRFKRFAIGIAPKLILGRSYSEGTLTSSATISSDAIVHDFDYSVRSAGAVTNDFINAFDLFSGDPFRDVDFSNPVSNVAGKGVGMDLGVTYFARKNLLVSASLTDLGKVTWNTDAQIVTPVNNSFRFEGFTLDRARIDRDFNGDIGQYAQDVLDSLSRNAYQEINRAVGNFSTNLPTALHLGTALYGCHATLNAGMSMGLNTAPGNLSKTPSFYTGGEYRLGPIPIRGGIRLGGDGALMVAGGIGLQAGFYEFGISVAGTPRSNSLGTGGRYSVAISMVNIRI